MKNALKAAKSVKGKLGLGAGGSSNLLATLKAANAKEKEQSTIPSQPSKVHSLPLERIDDEEEKSVKSTSK